MALILNDRVHETTASSGVGVLQLSGPVLGAQSFASGIGANQTLYVIISATGPWESGVGTATTSGVFTRNQVYANSLGQTSAIIFSTDVKDVICSLPGSVLQSLIAATSGASNITALTGDVTAIGPGSVAATLSTGVNANVGTFAGATLTLNNKGLVTAAVSGSGITALTGDGTAVGPGSVALALSTGVNANVGLYSAMVANNKGLITGGSAINVTGDITGITSGAALSTTLATVNTNVGTYNSPNFTVNAKGLVTAVTSGVGANIQTFSSGVVQVNSITAIATMTGASVSTFLRGDGNWLTPSAGSASVVTSLIGDATASAIGSATTVTLTLSTGTNANVGLYVAMVANNKGLITSSSALNVTGDITGVTSGAALSTTLATVNTNVGTYNSPNFTVNAKGLITAVTSGVGANIATFSSGVVQVNSVTAIATMTGASVSTFLRGDGNWLNPSGTAGTTTSLIGDATASAIGSTATVTITFSSGVNPNVGLYSAWTVNNKGLSTGGSAINVTGDITGVTSGAALSTTLATVNTNVGTYNSPNFTVNGKGLVTAVTSGVGANITTFSSGVVQINSVTAIATMTGASVSTFLRGDGNWLNPSGTAGTVTSVIGDATTSGIGSTATVTLTLSTGVNVNVGTFIAPTLTLNNKGLVTAATSSIIEYQMSWVYGGAGGLVLTNGTYFLSPGMPRNGTIDNAYAYTIGSNAKATVAVQLGTSSANVTGLSALNATSATFSATAASGANVMISGAQQSVQLAITNASVTAGQTLLVGVNWH